MMDFAVSRYKNDMIETLKKLIEIPSVKGEPAPNMPYGKDVCSALMTMLDIAEIMDFDSVNLFGHMGYVSYGTGKDNLAIIVHLDVVPPGEGWETPPFKAVEKNGRIYGRGAVDNKGPAVAALYALYALKQNCITLKRGVRIVFGCDEESEWRDVDFYLNHEGMPEIVITPDSSFPIVNTEKGLVQFTLKKSLSAISEAANAIIELDAGQRPNIVPNEAKCIVGMPYEQVSKAAQEYNAFPAVINIYKDDCGAKIIVSGKAAHGSMPEHGVNSIVHLIKFLKTLPLIKDDKTDFINALSNCIGEDCWGGRLGIAASDDISGKLTVNLGTLCFKNGIIESQIDIRYPISVELEGIVQKIKEGFAPYGIQVRVGHEKKGYHIPEDSELIVALKEVYEYCFKEPAEMLCSAGATYARAFDNGVAFGPIAKDAPRTEHGPNEYIEINDMVKLAEVLACAIMRLCEKASTTE